ncbi:MAG: copper amine oxidase N-terminal domain-containing protein [Clostridia bacterium]|nr:copper amine oxidase N-terminal domain-containing protein [Clostridia bacterium]
MSIKKKILSLSLSFAMAAFSAPAAFAGTTAAYLKPDVTVRYNTVSLEFSDVNGNSVFPVIYGGSVYLPIRAVSEIMNENIQWSGEYKSIYIGRTLESPTRRPVSEQRERKYAKENPDFQAAPGYCAGLVDVVVRPEVLILYDFEAQNFKDAQGNPVYPLFYNGSSYLPVRAVAELMGKDIYWESKLKTVFIGSLVPLPEETESEDDEEKPQLEKPVVKDAVSVLLSVFDRDVELFDASNKKLASINTLETDEEKLALAQEISGMLQLAQGYNKEAAELDTGAFTKKELAAYNKLVQAAAQIENYELLLENIAYMAASGTDFSILAETFYEYALQTSTILDETSAAIEALIDN